MNINEILPWQSEVWRLFSDQIASGRLPHAILLTGIAGIGKRQFGRLIAHTLLCENRTVAGLACGQCVSCRLISSGSHPDLRLIRPDAVARAEGNLIESEESSETAEVDVPGPSDPTAKNKAGRDITVHQIRDLADFVAMGAHRGGAKVVMIYPAEAMNHVAANALLKTLEEPAPGVVYMLASDAPHRLLPTIRSRCRIIDMPVPDFDQAAKWLSAQGKGNAEQLRACGGAPIRVVELAGSEYWEIRAHFVSGLARGAQCDPISLAKTIDTDLKRQADASAGTARAVDLVTVIGWLQRWIYDALSVRLTQTFRYHETSMSDTLQQLAKSSSSRLSDYYAWLIGGAHHARHPVNQLLFLEDCLLRYRALFEQR